MEAEKRIPVSRAQERVRQLYLDFSQREDDFPGRTCPVELTRSFLELALTQGCGTCDGCQESFSALLHCLDQMREKKADATELEMLECTARELYNTADCVVSYEVARAVLEGFPEISEDYQSHLEQGRCCERFEAIPCMVGCPARVDIPGYIALLQAGEYADAIRLIRRVNPFPSVCGLVCENPCERNCRRSRMDGAVNIRGLKRFAVERAGQVPPPDSAPATGKRVAIVGGGPSGLTAAYFLRLAGHAVTVYESRPKLGGMLRYGIPRYRLPAEDLDRDIQVILDTGVQVQLDARIGTEVSKLRSQYDSVYLSIGAHGDKKLGVEGEWAKGVHAAVEFLAETGDGAARELSGRQVVVIGGGNVAMDAARTAIRLGAESVKCIYRRRISDMPALEEEISGAQAEGCVLLPLRSPTRVEYDEAGVVTGLMVQEQRIEEISGGRFRAVQTEAAEENIACDIIIVAIGQEVEHQAFSRQGIVARWEQIQADQVTMTALAGVFAGGDCVSGPATVIRAIEHGKVAAAAIGEYLSCGGVSQEEVVVPPPVGRARGRMERVNLSQRDPNCRTGDFALTEENMTSEQAQWECARCLRCDHHGKGAFRREH